MKKLLIAAISLAFVMESFAQEAEDKNIQAGIVLGTGLLFTNTETNLIDKEGVGGTFVAGMSLDWHFLDNISFSTGLEFDFDRYRYKFNEAVYVDYLDREVLRKRDDNSNASSLLLQERRTRTTYATIPTMLRFQTNYLGYMRYFGRFGLRNSFLLSSRGDLTGLEVDPGFIPGSLTTLDDMNLKSDLSFYRGSIGLSAGGEWNFTGGTCLVAELGYYMGITNLHNGDRAIGDADNNKSIYTGNQAAPNYVVASAKQNMLLLKVSLLF